MQLLVLFAVVLRELNINHSFTLLPDTLHHRLITLATIDTATVVMTTTPAIDTDIRLSDQGEKQASYVTKEVNIVQMSDQKRNNFLS